MKGTQKKANNQKKNQERKHYLKTNPKELAENSMIVDLIRNDIGKISYTGSVQIRKLFHVEEYETILQMVSVIESRLCSSVRQYEFWKSIFPSGSVTGAPKISAMQWIEILEIYSRGVYTGSIGWIAPDGESHFNVAIRTLFGNSQNAFYFTGSGITYDSNPKREFQECLEKIRFLKEVQKILKPDFIFTTMKYCGGIIFFEKSHIQRLIETKKFFQIPVSEKKIILKFQRLKRKLRHSKIPVRIHFRINRRGKIQIILNTISKKRILKIKIARQKLNSDNIFLFYKTSHRIWYEQAREKTNHTDEVIFFNQKNHLMEGTFTNIILKIKGKLITPSIKNGLLNGIFRQKLIKRYSIIEMEEINEELFKQSEQIFLVNSVRGIMMGQIIDEN